MDIHEQAAAYARFVKARGIKHVAFYPDKKTSSAMPNTARRLFLAELMNTRAAYWGASNKYAVIELQRQAEAQGYTFHEVSWKDYDPKHYKEDIREEMLNW